MADEQNPVVPVVPTPTEAEPNWLKPRLEQAERSTEKKILEQLGVTDFAAASKAIAAAKAAEEANKTAEQKAADLAAANATLTASSEKQAKVIASHALKLFSALTPEQQASVKQIAGEDPLKTLDTINALAPTWGLPQATPVPSVTTAPGRNMPVAGDTAPTTDHHAVYQSLAANPFAAARYATEHPEVYQPKS